MAGCKHSKPQALLLGNGLSAVSRELGVAIDAFAGIILRFDGFVTKGYEAYVGSRTDIWTTCGIFRQHTLSPFRQVLYISPLLDEQTDAGFEHLSEIALTKPLRIPYGYFQQTKDSMGYSQPSSAATVTTYLIESGYDVLLYGFDFVLLNRPIHYCHEGEEKPYDNPLPEWRFFQNHIMAERVKHFALDPERESIPIVRQPTPCGNDRNLQAGRESCQGGWYDWIGRQARGLEILDVGAGMCDGMRIMERQGAKVTGFDIDSRLKGMHPNLIVSENLSCFGNDAFDVVTCIDVIEHVLKLSTNEHFLPIRALNPN